MVTVKSAKLWAGRNFPCAKAIYRQLRDISVPVHSIANCVLSTPLSTEGQMPQKYEKASSGAPVFLKGGRLSRNSDAAGWGMSPRTTDISGLVRQLRLRRITWNERGE